MKRPTRKKKNPVHKKYEIKGRLFMRKIYKKLIIAFCYVLIAMPLLYGINPVTYDVTVGDTCPTDVYAPRSVVDKFTTQKLKAEAAAAVEPQFEFDNNVTQRCQSKLASLFIAISEQREKGDVESPISPYCQRIGNEEYQTLRTVVTEVQQDVLTKGVLGINEGLEFASELLKERLYNDEAEKAANELISATLEINKTYSEEKTEAERQRVRDAVPDVTYKPNQIIIRKGEIITEAQYAVMADLGLITGGIATKFVQSIGVLVLVFMCFVVAFIYMKHNNKDNKFTLDMAVMVSVICALTMQMLYVNSEDFNVYTLPMTVAAVLTAVLVNVKFSILINILIAVLTGIGFKGNAFYIATVLFSGTAGAFMFAKATMRKNLVISSLSFCAITMFVFFTAGIAEGIEIKGALYHGLYGVLSALVTSVVVIGTLPVWETIFDVVTPYRLTELSNSNQPVLKKLIVEAPGTYHHSLMVGNLAEAACEAIGGDHLLARVCAYYHDIGKLSNPEMFVENQYVENFHDNLTPEISAEIIMSHVKKGLQLADLYRLPKVVKNIIASHHGTTKAAFFYHKAKEEKPDVDEAMFTYKGPKPQTREEAVVMLADSVEAAVRSLDEKSEAAISDMINKIIKEKLSDGQLSLSPLTFAEINTIKAAFIKVFSGYFHSRVKYPEKKEADE
jgi:putative nucleotidyltransferase with HDIG domain